MLVDLDPQGNASTGLGLQQAQRVHSSYDLLLGDVSLEDAAIPTLIPNLDIVPATVDLSGADIELVEYEDRTGRLKAAFDKSDAHWDICLIDCPPSLGLTTVNALVAVESLLVPLQCEFFALEGLSQLLQTVERIQGRFNPALSILGVALTMYDKRNNLSLQVEADARDNLGDLVFRTVVPRNVRISEAPSYALPVLSYDTASKGAAAYRALARDVALKRALISDADRALASTDADFRNRIRSALLAAGFPD
mgnify:CR=1 FL=1